MNYKQKFCSILYVFALFRFVVFNIPVVKVLERNAFDATYAPLWVLHENQIIYNVDIARTMITLFVITVVFIICLFLFGKGPVNLEPEEEVVTDCISGSQD